MDANHNCSAKAARKHGRTYLFVCTLALLIISSCTCSIRHEWEDAEKEFRHNLFMNSIRQPHHGSSSSFQSSHTMDSSNTNTGYSSSQTSYGNSSDTDYAHDGHPGTKPDDPLFGFDPWDDEDNAYDVERDFSDPYPDEW